MGSDRVLRAITNDGAFRVLTVASTDTVAAVCHAQHVNGPIAATLADLVTGAVLVRETMAPELRLQAIVQAGDRKSRLVADTHPDGATRGLAQVAPGTREVEPGGVLQVMRTLHNGMVQQGVVAMPEAQGMSAALMEYMQTSEQIVSVIAVASVAAGGAVVRAGGFIVQLLPELSEAMLAIMTERLRAFPSMHELLGRGAMEPRELLHELLHDMPYGVVGERRAFFGCQCSEARLSASLATLPRKEVQSFIDAGKVLEICCDYCGHDYRIEPEVLRGLLSQN